MTDINIPNLHQLGMNHGHGNLLGIEPYMIPQDYASADSFYNKLKTYLLTAQREGWLNEKTIVVFPEYMGSWLVLANEHEQVYRASTFSAAQRALVFHNIWKFIKTFLASTEKSKTEAAFFRMKAKRMAEIYHNVFSRLAREFAVTIIAGSIILPALHISNGQLILSEGPLYNITLVYQPDGKPHPRPVLKIFPTSQELTFTSYSSTNDLPSFDTPAGCLGVLICADSWFPQAYESLKEHKIDLLAVPSFGGITSSTWNDLWNGYNGWEAPGDVDAADRHRLTEGQAWIKYALSGRIHSSGARCGVNVFLRGKLWDHDSGGWPGALIKDAEIFVEERTDKAAILNVWI